MFDIKHEDGYQDEGGLMAPSQCQYPHSLPPVTIHMTHGLFSLSLTSYLSDLLSLISYLLPPISRISYLLSLHSYLLPPIPRISYLLSLHSYLPLPPTPAPP